MAKVLDVLNGKEKEEKVEEVIVPEGELPEEVKELVDERKTIGETVTNEVTQQI